MGGERRNGELSKGELKPDGDESMCFVVEEHVRAEEEEKGVASGRR